ncbi:ABC-three component system middle component 6 [Zavarzinella formosa]|uniref:ABC-three component system middle component 6 n=1 Tax=Zavarzinella formosa TaxID=360055 RepID=UPI00037582CE
MILPTKRLSQDRSLLYVGAEILRLLDEPKTVSRIWQELQSARSAQSELTSLTYDWFVLSLDLLFLIHAIRNERGRLEKAAL